MKKILKLLLIIALIAIAVGGAAFGLGYALTGGDLTKLSHIKIQQKEYVEKADNPISSINVESLHSTDITVIFSDSAENVVLSYPRFLTRNDKEADSIQFSDNNGALYLQIRPIVRKMVAIFGLPASKITLTLPTEREYALNLETDTGDIRLENTANEQGKFTSLKLNTDTGDILTQNITFACLENVELETDTGDVILGAFSAKNLSVETDTGDITLLKTAILENTAQLSIDTGDLRIKSKLSAKNISVETDTGDVFAQDGLLDAVTIKIETDTGDIKALLIGKQTDYSIYKETNVGDSNIPSQSGGSRQLFLSLDTGDVYVTFDGSDIG